MTAAHKIAVMFTVSLMIIVISFVLSVVSPAFSTTMYKDENINLPGLTEDRYTGESRTNVVTLIESLIPAMLLGTSGQCGEDSRIDC